jgi:tricorn protease interacting factor F2/3
MTTLRPRHYHLRIEPDLDRFEFSGTVRIRFEAAAPVDEITLNLLELAVWHCAVAAEEGDLHCAFSVHPEAEEMRVRLPKASSGEIDLHIDYHGRINDLMAGFYRSQYIKDGAERAIAVTQFQESDARRAFPCIDQPAAKATFDIEMDIERTLTALSNGAVRETRELANGKKRVIFEQTPPMSTYLVFWGVGEFEVLPDAKDPRVRVAALPERGEVAEYGAAFGRRALQFSENYYDIPYPLSKMDLIAIPDFAFGAMENWGAITFRENLLLYYPGTTSKSGEQRICEVIAHEIAHQWFGNLVTPSEWKYLWLNESFATYFGFGVVAHYHPDWQIWDQFLSGMTAPAMLRDGLNSTVAIEIPGGEHVVINSSTAPIIYNKGGSILRQIQGYIGDESFRNGLRRYLKHHAYANADSRHLWEALEAASEKPVQRMMKGWVEQPGYPIIEVACDNGRLKLKQRRFSYLPQPSEQTWPVPVAIELFDEGGRSRTSAVLLEAAETEVEIGDGIDAYKLNPRQTGFYRTHYLEPEALKNLGKRVAAQTLPPEDRWGLQADLYALVRNGTVPFRDYLSFLAVYRDETAFLPLSGICENLLQARLILDGPHQKAIDRLAAPWLESVLEAIGCEPAGEERHTVSILRDQLIWHAVRFGSERVNEFALECFAGMQRGQALHPDIQKSVLQIGAWRGDRKTFEWFEDRLSTSNVEHERMNILTAMGCFRHPDALQRTLELILTGVPPRNKFIPVVAMAFNAHAWPFLWEWYASNLDRIESFHPMLYERVVGALIPSAGMDRPDEIGRFFENYLQKKDKAGEVIKLSLEKLKINLRMRQLNRSS